jgi:L-aspartate oxidase
LLIRSDFLVLGSGVAGLRAASDLAQDGDVIVVTKADPVEGNTGYAQGGIAAALGPGDSPALHGRDTHAAGDGLCDEAAVEVLVEEGPRYVRELIEWGARFDRDEEGRLQFAREAAHSVRRVLHARDATGREIARTLWHRVEQRHRIRILEHTVATAAIVREGRAIGMRVTSAIGEEVAIVARAILVATGGAGQVFRETTNPSVATGDGIAIAYRAGARVMDLEFVQFHPTALAVPGQPRFLLSEALRGEGARLVNRAGEPFMVRYEPAGDLAPRDRVSRAIAREADRTGAPVCLSLAHLPADFVHRRFPLIADACRQAGLDLARDPIPVGPAAHYLMGGVWTDLDGRTSLPGLFAAGEVACTGVHGANRLASNSLLEGLVFGARAAAAMRRFARDAGMPAETAAPSAQARRTPAGPAAGAGVQDLVAEVRDLMWRSVGLVRDASGLAAGVARLEAVEAELDALVGRSSAARPDAERARMLVTLARLMARAALRRQESRGGHYRSDFPERDDVHWKRHVCDALG